MDKKVQVSQKLFVSQTILKSFPGIVLMGVLVSMGIGIDYDQKLKCCILLIFVVTILATILSISNYRKFVSPINLLFEYIDRLNDKDLTYSIDISKALGQADILRKLNKSTQKLDQTIKKVIEVFEQIRENSQHLSEGSAGVMNITNEVGRDIQVMSEGSKKHVNDIDTMSKSMNIISEQIANLNETSKSIFNKSNTAYNVSLQGQDRVLKLIDKAKESSMANSNAIEAIELLNDKSKEITIITDTIINIAEQTNLLSLNASIEAVKAGEHGRGFVVVAEEIRKLAEQSSFSVKQITDLINEIQQYTSDTTEAIKYMRTITEQQNSSVEDTKSKFMDIASSFDEIRKEISIANKSVEEITASKDILMNMVDSVLYSSNDIAQLSYTAIDLTSKQNLLMMNSKSKIELLNQGATEMRDILEEFKV